MVEHVIRTVDRNVSYKEVVASRGKVAGPGQLRLCTNKGGFRASAYCPRSKTSAVRSGRMGTSVRVHQTGLMRWFGR